METKKHERDRGRVLGKFLTGTLKRARSKLLRSSDDETAPLLKKYSSSKSGKHENAAVDSHPNLIHRTPPTYKEVAFLELLLQIPHSYPLQIFTPQTNWSLMSYACLSLHVVAADQLLPIFLHYPRQENLASNPDVQLPFKFSGGFGLQVSLVATVLWVKRNHLIYQRIQADRIGLLFTLYGVIGMSIQLFVFPSVARHYGVLTCLKTTTIILPVTTFLIPFTTLLPTSAAQQIVLSLILMVRSCASIFAYPCSAIMLTNSASTVRVLGRLNGVATSFCAIGRAIGPAIGGWAFTLGVDIGYVILPWWTLTAISLLCMIPVSQLVEMEGFAADNVVSVSETDEPGQLDPNSGNIIASSYERQSQAVPVMSRHDSTLSLAQPGCINTVETPDDIVLSGSLQRIRSTTSDSFRRINSNTTGAS